MTSKENILGLISDIFHYYNKESLDILNDLLEENNIPKIEYPKIMYELKDFVKPNQKAFLREIMTFGHLKVDDHQPHHSNRADALWGMYTKYLSYNKWNKDVFCSKKQLNELFLNELLRLEAKIPQENIYILDNKVFHFALAFDRFYQWPSLEKLLVAINSNGLESLITDGI